jgi:NADPH:quinone reductase-like Zn-dependent oxidoreductase
MCGTLDHCNASAFSEAEALVVKTYQFKEPKGVDALEAAEVGEKPLGADDVRVEMKAWSLNYRDLGVPNGGYARNDKILRNPPLVPLSDGAGVVAEVGDAVTQFEVGDPVASCFFRDWERGAPTEGDFCTALGGGIDGTLAERVVLPERGWVRAPRHMNLAEAATLPCAAVTAWQALTAGGLTAGQSVLVLGTGGVSIFALQLAKAAGCRVLLTSNSDEKIERAKALGADETLNYRKDPTWEKAVRDLTGGEGVDHVVEVGGVGTLEKSLAAAKIGGTVSLIGVLTGVEGSFSSIGTILNALTLRGIFVGSREMFREMNRALEVSALRPVIDRSFDFGELSDVKAAYAHLQSGNHFGKVVIERA